MLGPKEIEHRFGFHKATIEGENATLPKHRDVRLAFREFAEFLDGLLPEGRATSVMFTELENASMWAHKAIAELAPAISEPPVSQPTPAEVRSSLVVGEFFPDATTTGIYDEKILEIVPASQVFDTPNQVIENKHFKGRVSVRAANVHFRNCLFTGPDSKPLEGGLIIATHPLQKGLVLEDCTIAPTVPSHTTNCIEGYQMTLLRVNSYHGVDLCSVIAPADGTRADVTIEGSWLHDPAMFNTTTQKDNLTHNDVIQWHGMKGLTVKGCRLEGYCAEGIGVVADPPKRTWNGELIQGNPYYPERWGTSVLMASPLRATFGDFVFTDNWLDGAAVGLNLTRDPIEGFPDCGVITGNRFGKGWRLGPDFGILAKSAQAMRLEGNYRWNEADPWDTSVSFNDRKKG